MLPQARLYHGLGFVPIPLTGKRPLYEGWAAVTRETCLQRWPEGGGENLGLRTGPESGLLVVDVDVKDGGLARWGELVAINGEPDTAKVRTPSGGLHIYFRFDTHLAPQLKTRARAGHGGAGIDIRAAGGQVVAPPSQNDQGTAYRWLLDVAPFVGEGGPGLPLVPAWLFEELTAGKGGQADGEGPGPASTRGPGCRRARPRLGDSVSVAGVSVDLSLELVEQVLARVPCPGDVAEWSGILANVKSVLAEGDAAEVDGAGSAAQLYRVFDSWAQTGPGYDAEENRRLWAATGTPTASFETLLGIAVRAGWRAPPPPRPALPPIQDPGSDFYMSDLLAREFRETPRRFGELGEAFRRCLAHTSGLRGVWIAKERDVDGSPEFALSPVLAMLSKYSFQVILDDRGNVGKKRAAALAEALLDEGLLDDYEGVDVLPYPPGAAPPQTRFFNLFPGFCVAPAPQPDLELLAPIVDHLREVWASGDEGLFAYIRAWLAHLVQKPAVKPGTILVLRGAQGCGKSLPLTWIGQKVLGRQLYLETTDIEKVTGRFNAAIQGRRLVVLSEMGIAGDAWHSTNDRLKALITDEHVAIERKGMEVQTIRNASCFALLSNNSSPLKVESSDRRSVCVEVSSHRCGDAGYFARLAAAFDDPRAPAAFMRWLMDVDLAEVDVRRAPETRMKATLRYEGLPAPVRFLAEEVEVYLQREGYGGGRQVPVDRLFADYVAWSENNREKTLGKTAFGKVLAQVGVEKSRGGGRGERAYYYDLFAAAIPVPP